MGFVGYFAVAPAVTMDGFYLIYGRNFTKKVNKHNGFMSVSLLVILAVSPIVTIDSG